MRLSANIPEVIVLKWEEAIKRENGGYLPFNRSVRLELAILEQTRVIEKRLSGSQPSVDEPIANQTHHGQA